LQHQRILGTHEGFGINFKTKHGLEIEEVKTLWPQSKLSKRPGVKQEARGQVL
jgi:hypothetical protein